MNITEEEMPINHCGTTRPPKDPSISTIEKDESINMDELLQKAGKIQSAEISSEVGEIVEMDDGTAGVVIDLNEGMDKLKAAAKIESLENLVNGSVPLYEQMSGDVEEGSIAYGDRVIEMMPNSEYATAIMEVKKVFKDFSPSLKGLSEKNSSDCVVYQQGLDALRKGEYRLPTVEEYEQQKEDIRRKQMETHDAKVENNEMNTQQKVVNLAAMETVASPQQPPQNNVQEEPPQSAQNTTPMQVTEFRVPEGRALDFISSMSEDDKNKVTQSKEIHIVEERLVSVPKATRRITSLDAYKRIAKTDVTSEAVEVPMLNSGYIAIVNGCGSLELASILPDVQTMEWEDYAKVYNFCFKHLVSTSIGVLSFKRFQIKTSPYDLDGMVHAILRASQPDVNGITLTCGGENCGKDYDVKYTLSSLPDWESVTDEVRTRIDELLRAKSLQDDAMEIHEKSPVMQEKYVDIGDGKIVAIKSPNGPMIVERTNDEIMRRISDITSPLTALMLLNVRAIFTTMPDETGEEQTYEIVDPHALAMELQSFSDTQLEILKKEFETLETYDPITYSFKGMDGGDIVCPHCGFRNKRVPCKVQQLVFQKVSKALK